MNNIDLTAKQQKTLEYTLKEEWNTSFYLFKKDYAFLNKEITYTPHQTIIESFANSLDIPIFIAKYKTVIQLDEECQWEASLIGLIDKDGKMKVGYNKSHCNKALKIIDIKKVNNKITIKCNNNVDVNIDLNN
ncbi:MAG: hypothetical protein ACPG5B_11080 [Chitinophagales bacterium]